jgi:hypothetical protein
LIGCMCHSTENLLNYYETSLARASDDFYPKVRFPLTSNPYPTPTLSNTSLYASIQIHTYINENIRLYLYIWIFVNEILHLCA